jgi:DNA repair exonuclease SbcCD nuclease subunit
LGIGDCAIHALPHMYSDEELRDAVASLKADGNFKYNIMVAHAAVRGAQIASWGEFKEQTIPLDALKPEFNYIALGHYHRFLRINGTQNAYYCGSPERFSFNEVADKKGFVEVELDSFTVKHIPTNAREMVIFDPIDCTHLSAAEVMKAIASLIDGKVEGKIVKVIFKNISREVHSSLDLQAVRDLVSGALHYDPEYQWKIGDRDGDSATSRIGSLSEEFVSYLNRIDLSEAERKEMMELGSKYLQEVVEEEEAIVTQ